MPSKLIPQLFIRIVCFGFMFLLGVGTYNLLHLQQKFQMWQLVNDFHKAQINNDKELIDTLLTDNFTEIGAKRFVQTPGTIYKKDFLDSDFSRVNFTIQAKYPVLLNIFANSDHSLSFVRELTIFTEDGKALPPVSYYVTYTFKGCAEGLKLIRIERKF